MYTQYDGKMRVVVVENLRAMCRRISGMAHRFEVTTVSRSRVHVTYSNPDEYGSPRPMTAVFPCFPNDADPDHSNPYVVLSYLRVLGDNWNGEGWQAFEQLRDCPTMFRGAWGDDWRTHRGIRQSGHDRRDPNQRDFCTVCDIKPEDPPAVPAIVTLHEELKKQTQG